jgi:Zn-dependent membrane protease YugP
MKTFITKLWLILLFATVLALSLIFSVFLFAAVLILALITVPYVFYLKWKAKKDLEEIEKEWIEAEYEWEEKKMKELKEKF